MSIPQELADHPAIRRLQSAVPGAVLEAASFRGELALLVDAGRIREVCDFLRRDPELKFNFLADLTAVDRYPLEPRFEIVYNLMAIPSARRLRVKARVPGSDARLATVSTVWPGANWFEREVFDLFGVRFDAHPDLRRLLMPDDWEGHPLRKDYPVEGYR